MMKTHNGQRTTGAGHRVIPIAVFEHTVPGELNT